MWRKMNAMQGVVHELKLGADNDGPLCEADIMQLTEQHVRDMMGNMNSSSDTPANTPQPENSPVHRPLPLPRVEELADDEFDFEPAPQPGPSEVQSSELKRALQKTLGSKPKKGTTKKKKAVPSVVPGLSDDADVVFPMDSFPVDSTTDAIDFD
jgi:hypothetical protein